VKGHHEKRRITVVRIAVAKFESTPVTPVFTRTAVAPAKRTEDFVVALKNGSRLPLQGES
jgi:hypothetical protein